MIASVAAAQAEHVVEGEVGRPRRLRVPRAVPQDRDPVEHRVGGLSDDEQEAAEGLAERGRRRDVDRRHVSGDPAVAKEPQDCPAGLHVRPRDGVVVERTGRGIAVPGAEVIEGDEDPAAREVVPRLAVALVARNVEVVVAAVVSAAGEPGHHRPRFARPVV